MGCFQKFYVGCLCTLVLIASACSSDDDKKPSNNTQVECQTNAECAPGVCDLATFTCTGQSNNANNANNANNSNNVNNVNNSNNANNGGVCGDGTVDANEICDGNCPANCEDNDACTTDVLAGSGATCDAVCANDPVTACVDNDNCCPAGCDATNDLDCATCGNGVLDANEICDPQIPAGTAGACPTAQDCVDVDACTTDALVGQAAQCTAECVFTQIVALIDGDLCCPDPLQFDINDDDDCPAPAMSIGGACTVDVDCPPNALADPGFCLTEVDADQPGGYCTVQCQIDADCGAGATCNGFLCVDECAINADCRTGYTCYDFDGNGSLECAVDPIAGDPPGDACLADTDCQPNLFGGFCVTEVSTPNFAGGMCTQTCIADDSLCQEGSHCSNIDPADPNLQGLCTDDCLVDADCRAGYGCFDFDNDNVNECWPSAAGNGVTGDACASIQDCTGGNEGFCIDAVVNADFALGYCSETCVVDADCPGNASCTTLSNGFQLCTDDCVTVADCRADYSCLDLDNDNTSECWPSATGNGVPGDACARVQDCAGGALGICAPDPDWPQGYCIVDCTNDANLCVATSECVDFGNGSSFCLDSCQAINDCRAGYDCAPAGGLNDSCIPL